MKIWDELIWWTDPFNFQKKFHIFTNLCTGKNKAKESVRAECNRDLYMDDIEQLALANTPDVFGLHPNAEIGYYTTAAKGYFC